MSFYAYRLDFVSIHAGVRVSARGNNNSSTCRKKVIAGFRLKTRCITDDDLRRFKTKLLSR